MKTVFLLLSFIVASGHFVHAQQGESIRRIGYLDTGFKPPKEFSDAIQKLGYVDGQNIIFEYRSAEREERLAELVSDLLQRNVSVIVASGAAAGLAARAATKMIPIVYLGGGDPVSLGLAASLAHPGGNVTGITELSPELTAKRLELLKEAFPKISQVAVIAVRDAPGIAEQLETLERKA
jgi:putative tryptophan/tyrosine transport system substrate-binding protein